jgi:hypothetical protein
MRYRSDLEKSLALRGSFRLNFSALDHDSRRGLLELPISCTLVKHCSDLTIRIPGKGLIDRGELS